MKNKIKVFKTETFGAVDGPGVRLVIFILGCSFRCKYCHNPESWTMNYKPIQEMSVKDIISLYERNQPFYEKGGITISGGEPMLSADFIKLLARECKTKKIHLAIDTSACNFLQNKKVYDELINLVDLWIVDIKAMNEKEHQYITGYKGLVGIEFVKYLEQKKKAYWIRQVVIKGVNDDAKHLDELAAFIKPLKYCKKYELLSFHNLASDKYKKLKIDYPFADKELMSTPEFEQLKIYLNNKVSK